MKVCVFNIEKDTRDAIDDIVGSMGIYCSRSEFVRCAIREYLLYFESKELPQEQNPEVVHIPNEIEDERGNIVTTYLKYKVVRRLESAP